MPETKPMVAGQFEDAQQQYEAANLGMWVFIATEILFFGGLFLAYLVYRHFYFPDFAAASRHTDLFFGTLNSVILLTSSYTMAISIHFARLSRTNLVVRFLLLTLLLGISFLIVKTFEYHKDIMDHLVPGPQFNPSLHPPSQIFFWLYWCMTGLHAVHICVGLGLMPSPAGIIPPWN
jgi:cytochrome c oxidase subunit III